MSANDRVRAARRKAQSAVIPWSFVEPFRRWGKGGWSSVVVSSSDWCFADCGDSRIQFVTLDGQICSGQIRSLRPLWCVSESCFGRTPFLVELAWLGRTKVCMYLDSNAFPQILSESFYVID